MFEPSTPLGATCVARMQSQPPLQTWTVLPCGATRAESARCKDAFASQCPGPSLGWWPSRWQCGR
eukprot:9647326-Lingulodinium_polyedra.AAC.1